MLISCLIRGSAILTLEEANGGICEILADSDEEQELHELTDQKVTRVKGFAHRLSYRRLDSLGVAQIPPGSWRWCRPQWRKMI